MSRITDFDVPIDCPSCRRKVRKRLSQLSHGRTYRCPCGQQITIQGNGFTDVKRSLDKLERTIKRIGR